MPTVCIYMYMCMHYRKHLSLEPFDPRDSPEAGAACKSNQSHAVYT